MRPGTNGTRTRAPGFSVPGGLVLKELARTQLHKENSQADNIGRQGCSRVPYVKGYISITKNVLIVRIISLIWEKTTALQVVDRLGDR